MNSAEKQAVLHCLKSMIDEAVCEECPLYGTTGTDHCEEDCVRLAINALEESCEMTAEEYRQRMIQAFHNADCDELIALVVLPTEKEFEHLEWLLEKHYKAKPEPCTDAISREDALQALCKAVHKNDDTIPCLNQRVSCLWDKTKVQDYAEEILKLSPVTPAEKVAQWITVDKGLMVTSYKCSECGRTVSDDTGYDVTKDYPYCHCGARMQEVKDEVSNV